MKPTYQADSYQCFFPAEGSRLVYGTSGLGGVWGHIDVEESIACLAYAFENGISRLDTAPSYNRSEEIVGKALRRWKGDRPFVSTKIGRLKSANAFEMVLDYSPQAMKDSINRSLDLLGLDNVDLLFLHEPQLVPIERIEEILDTLKLIQAEGFTKRIGLGGNPPRALLPYIIPENFQVVSGYCKLDACNLEVLSLEMPWFIEKGIYYYAASSLHFALLGNRFQTYTSHPPEGELAKYITPKDIRIAIKVKEIAESQQMDLATLAQRYLFSVKEATCVVIGARNLKQIESSIRDWEQGALPEDLFELVTKTIIAAA